MNISLGDLEDYVQQKLSGGGYGSAAEVVREALRAMQIKEREEAISHRLKAFIIDGIDQGPPPGVSDQEWDDRLTSTHDRFRLYVQQGIDSVERGDVISPEESRRRSQELLDRHRAKETPTQ